MPDRFLKIPAAENPIVSCERRYALSVSLVNDFLPGQWTGDVASDSIDHLPGNMEATELPIAHAVMPPGGLTLPATSWDESPAIQGPSLPSSVQAALNDQTLLSQAEQIGEALGLRGQGQTIAVIDSGIAYDHMALGGGYGPGYRVVGGWDFAENDADPYDDAPSGYHGTHVAGLVGGNGRFWDGQDFLGVAPESDLVALRVFDDAGNGGLQWIESALQWVHDNQDAFESPITTVNLSLGTELSDATRDGALALLEDELQALYEDDILVFAAAGNGQASLGPGQDEMLYPASSAWVSAVGSIDAYGNLSDFSQRSSGIFAAEGEQLQSSVPEHVQGYDGYLNDYTSLSGTSMASPQIAAASALVRQAMHEAGMDVSSDAILQRMQDTADQHVDPVTGTPFYTLNLEAAVDFSAATDNVAQPATISSYQGTQLADHVVLDLSGLISGAAAGDPTGIVLSDAGGAYQVDLDGSAQPMVIDASGGGDTLRILGSQQSEQLLLRPPSAGGGQVSQLSFPGGVIELRGFENVTFVSGGGDDRATLYDSVGNDQLRAGPDAASFTGVGFEFHLEQVAKLYVHATSGGEDTAHLTDSALDDQLVIRPQFSSIRSDEHFQAVFGFERVDAYATGGGYDTADLGDSSGNDVMSISRDRSLISSNGYRASALGFESVVATASRGGDDTVRIYVDDPGGSWHTADSLTQWNGQDGTRRIARGFEHSEAIEQFATASQATKTIQLDQLSTDKRGQAMLDEAVEARLDAIQRLFEEL